MHIARVTLCLILLIQFGCTSPDPEGLAPSQPAAVTVKMDFYAKPLPEIPLPNDIATRYDETSPTKRRINASMIAPTTFEATARELIDEIDGWGVGQPITIPFTGPISVESILAGHRDVDYRSDNDVIYLIDITAGSPTEGELIPLDIGEGNYPVTLERSDYWNNDIREWTLSLYFDEEDEDKNGNGRLDPGEDLNGNGALDPGEDLNGNGELDPPEDTDADGVLDKPNYLPGMSPARDDLPGRADALMYFYESETNTIIAQPLIPLRERTQYAVLVTRRLKDTAGDPVGSPYDFINHTGQTEALRNLSRYLPDGLAMSDIAFAFSFTTQTVESDFVAVRDGLYGRGVQKHLGEEFPPRIDKFFDLFDTEHPDFSDLSSAKLLYGEDFASAYKTIAATFQGRSNNALTFALEGHFYVDYHAIGTFSAPQLFPREDQFGNPLGYNRQVWPQDLTVKKAPARAESIPFWIALPRKEVSARGENKPVPVVIMSHGYTSNRFGEVASFSSYFAQHGLATIGIECPSHGLSISEQEEELATTIFTAQGLLPFKEAALTDRAWDQNNDGRVDSGADFWTSYVFHTRDIVRQCALDHLTLVRLLKSFDGERRWDFDLNGDGEKDLAGDFDGDGHVDVGLGSKINMAGASLGGIMAAILGGLEPGIDAVAPIAGGGGLGNIGSRSKQGGVREAVMLRIMGPLFTTTVDENGVGVVQTTVPDLNDDQTRPLGTVEGLKPWDTMVVTNLDNGERGCSYISPEGKARTGLPSDIANPANLGRFMTSFSRVSEAVHSEEDELVDCQSECPTLAFRVGATCGVELADYTCSDYCLSRPRIPTTTIEAISDAVATDGRLCADLMQADRVKIDFYSGPRLVTGSEDCEVIGGSTPLATIDRFGQDIVFQSQTFRAGSPLVALAQGKGEQRATPGMRRFLGFGQLVLDPADPAVFARHFEKEPIYYPGTDESTATNAMIITTLGDMNVPASSGVHVARAAGFVDYTTPDTRYAGTQYEGLPPNQILIDTYVAEAVELIGRFNDGERPVHLDVENFSNGDDLWGDVIPRLDPPLRLLGENSAGGISGAIFPMGDPAGQHGFDLPGEQLDKAIARCRADCPEGMDCSCEENQYFDIGMYMFNVIGRYLATGGTVWNTDQCNAYHTCPDRKPRPELRRRQAEFGTGGAGGEGGAGGAGGAGAEGGAGGAGGAGAEGGAGGAGAEGGAGGAGAEGGVGGAGAEGGAGGAGGAGAEGGAGGAGAEGGAGGAGAEGGAGGAGAEGGAGGAGAEGGAGGAGAEGGAGAQGGAGGEGGEGGAGGAGGAGAERPGGAGDQG